MQESIHSNLPHRMSALRVIHCGRDKGAEGLKHLRAGSPSSEAAKPAADVPMIDRVRALCGMVGLGQVRLKDLSPEAVEAAAAAIKNRTAFQDSCYGDDISSYMQLQT